ncbi:MAG: hypothetical protein JSW61_14725 [Candidatus Thorarchaeota archaeon]|nr:MAG: hypothetical protein JSW61_14725 [Candidatus Thorarchaeota archaeon]
MSKADIRPPVNLKLASMRDLARMLVSWSQRDRPASMLYFEHNGKHIYGTLISNHGYYEYYGMPMWVYTEGEGPPEGNFLSYKSRPEESVQFMQAIESEPMVVYLPIITLADKLEVLDL